MGPPPKVPAVVHSFTTKGKTYAVLPQSFQSVPTVAAGSTLFDTALGNDKTLQGQLNADNKALDSFSKQTDSIVRAKDAEAAKYEAQKPSVWQNILHWVRWLSIPLLGIGLVCLCVFFPPAIPFVVAGLRLIIHLIGAFFRALGRLIAEIEAMLERKGGPGG